jgi:CDGSH-type Zn-finger protein
MLSPKEMQMPEAGKGKIEIVKNGPYLVSGGVPLSEQIIVIDAKGESHWWREGKRYPLQERYALCRCGESRNLPFCDGAHIRTKFDGTEQASRSPYLKQAVDINSASLRLTDVTSLCAEARFCQRAGTIWKLAERSGDPEARQIMIEEARDCPSGRLVVWNEAGRPIEPDFGPSIGLVQDAAASRMGPAWVRGSIPIVSADGTTYEIRNRVTMCRCGQSANKPFCDGRHLE